MNSFYLRLISYSNTRFSSLLTRPAYSPSGQTILDLDFSELDSLFAVNVRGMAASVKHAARAMVGKRVRVTDYIMSKDAVVGLMQAASVQLGARGISVNSVSPTALATPLTCKALGMSEEMVQEFYAQYARLEGVVITPKHVADDAVLFLVSKDLEFITGQDLKVEAKMMGFLFFS